MKTISIDIETYSGTDLNKCGVYKYTEDPDFEVLLFGYAVDGGEVHVVDLALGEKIPADISASLTDENVLKFAFNANFERVCLSRHLGLPTGKYLDPSSWRCTMVWAAYMGLPLSLQGVGAVLNLDKQKLTEGKELIKYFCSPCTPTKSNGGRTRNRPEDAPEKWSLFKSYNRRDVETEMGIQQKLTKFPVPEFVWDEYHIDQEINDRGVRLDIPLVDTAIRMDAASRQELMDDMRRITELENPNSVTQMRSWLADNGLETDTLGKKAVNEMLKTAPPELADALVLRQQLAKSSVKKYQAMQNAVCSDGRARGMFQFYGANRTGRWAGRLIQMQNLPQNHLSDLAEARGLVRSGDFEAVKMLYKETWKLAQAVAARHTPHRQAPNERYPFTGKLFCGVCGKPYYYYHYTTTNKKPLAAYRCMSHKTQSAVEVPGQTYTPPHKATFNRNASAKLIAYRERYCKPPKERPMLCTDVRIPIDLPQKAFCRAWNLIVAKKLRYQATLRSTVDNAEDILVRYRAEEMCLLIDEIGKITEFSYPLMLKTLDRVVVNTNGKLSFIFQSGIKITV